MHASIQKATVPRQQNVHSVTASKSSHLQQVTRANSEVTNLKILLAIEAESRAASTVDEWKFVVANETLKLSHAKQVFVFRCSQNTRVMAISGLASFERSGVLASNIEKIISVLRSENEDKVIRTVDPASLCPTTPGLLKDYPYKQLLWIPLLSRSNELLGGMLLASDTIWQDHDLVILKRLTETYAHALSSLVAEQSMTKQLKGGLGPIKLIGLYTVVFVLFTLTFPVSMSALAPFEIAPRNPIVITAPLDGVIENIFVEPNAVVQKGQTIISFADTILKNRHELSKSEVRVASAQQKKATQLAFDNIRGQQEFRIAIANHQLKIAKRNYSREMLDRASTKAQRGGVVLYSDKNALLGRPVKLGERIMLIANPNNIELQINVGVDDAIFLKPNARVKVFLDSDPVNSREAVIEYIEYQAKIRTDETLSYRIVAKLLGDPKNLPGLGVRGTAKLYGEDVPLAFYLFRRPLSALRQWVGI